MDITYIKTIGFGLMLLFWIGYLLWHLGKMQRTINRIEKDLEKLNKERR